MKKVIKYCQQKSINKSTPVIPLNVFHRRNYENTPLFKKNE